MVFNNDLRPVDTTLFYNKLDLLLQELNEKYILGLYNTREEMIEDFNRLLSQFYLTTNTPSLKLRPANEFTTPNVKEFNDSFREVGNDLTVAFSELATLEKTVIKNFNYIVSERDNLIKSIKRLNSKLDDYTIYATDPLKKVVYFKDSFNDSSKIDFGSKLLTKEQCDINTIEGIITLPIDSSSLSTSKKLQVKINQNSNGSPGNLQQISSAGPHDDIRDLLDGNPDSWFEYERVVTTLSKISEPLKLDLTLYFTAPEIINTIRINPNNFGLQIPIKILTIDTSLDGRVWTSIKDDIPISGFLMQDEENTFTLAPSTSKSSGQGVYSFTPRKVKYFHIVFEQNTSYRIETTQGWKWRYAIGIRDIVVQAIKYKAEGDIVSQSFNSPIPIRVLSVLANENPSEASELADIKHQISIDDGGTWVDIQPQDRSGTIVPEVLVFNIPVYSVRHRMLFSRSSAAFKKGASSMSREIRQAIDVIGVPTSSPSTMALTRSPVDGTVSVMNPLWGSRSLDGLEIRTFKEDRIERKKPIINIIGRSSGQANQKFRLPLEYELTNKIIEKGDVIIWIDNDTSWTYQAVLTDKENKYFLNNNCELCFGDGEDGNIPMTGSFIGFTLKEERLQPSADSPYMCDLRFPSDGSKKNLKIYRQDKTVGPITENLRPGATVHKLKNKNVLLTNMSSTDISLKTQVPFVDGQSELVGGTGDQYSVDQENGVIYSEMPSGTDTTGKITYYYIPIIELQESDWDFALTPDNRFNRIQIKNSVYMTSKIEQVYGDLIFDYCLIKTGYTNIIPRSIVFPALPFKDSEDEPIEVAFQNGANEFLYSSSSIATAGTYSVDYVNGIVYCNAGNTWKTDIDLKFETTNYTVVYNIARYLDPGSYSVNAMDQTISISEEEIIRVHGLKDSDITGDRILKVLYDYIYSTRESIEELEPYFTPVIRDVVIKVIPNEV